MNENPEYNNDIENENEYENGELPDDVEIAGDDSDNGVNQNDDASDNGSPPRQRAQNSDKTDKKVPSEPFKFTISGIIAAIRNFWTNLERKTKIYAIAGSGLAVVIIVILAILLNSSPMQTILWDLEQKEAGSIMGMLDASKIKYEYDAALNTIKVRESEASAAIGKLALAGYPESGFIAPQVASESMFSFKSEADKKNQRIKDLQDWLMATINTIAGIDYSLVTLAVPEDDDAIIKSEIKPTTASVILHLRGGTKLSDDTIKGIENIVQKSVTNLLSENITITDGNGIILNAIATNTDLDFSAVKMRLEDEQETKINKRVRELLENTYGVGNVSVGANVKIDVNKLIRESTTYVPSSTNEETGEGKGIPAAEAYDREMGSSTNPDIVGQAGTALNDDDPEYYNQEASEGELYNDSAHWTKEYLVSSVIEQMQKNAHDIIDVTVSVTINTKPLEDDVLEQVTNLVATASGIRDIAVKNAVAEDTVVDYDYYRSYITVLASPYNISGAKTPVTTPLPFGLDMEQLIILIAISVGVIILIVMSLMIARKIANKKRAKQEALVGLAGQGQGVLTPVSATGAPIEESIDVTEFGKAVARRVISDETEDIAAISVETREQMLTKEIRNFTEQHPEIAAQLIRTLIKEEGGT